ncbi:hypothetical protein [Candidatus Endomicrobiellum agilis]|uniref:hypothetical protein n=1 Tax=Candidatus Endomicrobiellum agilis TaxID=3238957 RepID=UPI003588E0E0|nr:hypothetical protein [Endomicrobium sp.]
MAFETKRISKFRSIMFGEIAFKKIELAFIMFGIYFITRPLQNILVWHPLPLMINCARQFFLMAIIAPSILVAIFHWVPMSGGIPRSTKFAAYIIGGLMGIIFFLLDSIAISGLGVSSSWKIVNVYDLIWVQSGTPIIQIVFIHLICQFVSPMGFLLLAAAYVRHKRHNYQYADVYNLIPTKWKYLEISLIIFAASFFSAGIAAIFGTYRTYPYIWSIYFIGAILSGIFELISIKLPPREAPSDLK